MKYVLSLVAFCLALILMSNPGQQSVEIESMANENVSSKGATQYEKVFADKEKLFFVDHLIK